ncbi:hypothetical protein [Armatimonas sp.]|uniref:hypothetical protein n=1 Tax=Armatimonas sp. TaxID=1872638 RepID=UPI00286D0F8F|nr:hypothetical protein [Armatimonas sp.]
MRQTVLILALLGSVLGSMASAQDSQRAGIPAILATPQPVEKRASVPDSEAMRFASEKISARVPLGWRLLPLAEKKPGILATLSPISNTGATLSLAFSVDAGRTKLPDNLPATIAMALGQRYPGFRLTAKQRFTLLGSDAWQLDGQVKPVGQSVLIKNRQVYVCHQGRIYITTLTCKKEDFERLTPSMDQFLKSMKWLDEPLQK